MNEALKALKSTLRLPSSKFPPRPPPEALNRYRSRCDELYAWQRSQRPADSANTFTLHDGPPYANGDLHVGHALNKITKDIICRTKLAEGRHVNYVPGWDCHGLPIELKAFEKHGWDRGSGVDPVKVRGAARGFAAKTVDKQMKVFKSWGIMADWDGHWKTMDREFELRQLEVFKAMAEHGLIVRRHKPVYWSPSSRTALAEAEIERDWHTSTAALVKFRIPAMIGGSTEPVHAVIWTTTPWTLPANQAIAIHKDLSYLLVRSKQHGNLIVSQSRVDYLNEQIGDETEILSVVPTEDLLNCTYSGLAQFGPDALERPIIHADFVTADDGTGLVHCAPGHGNEDFDALQGLIRSGRVSVKAPVNDKGEYTDAASPSDPALLAGKFVFKEGNKAILDLLKSENALVSSYEFKHKYPVDWRTKQPIIIKATAQWFADISKIKQDVVDSLEKVVFRPDSGKLRLKSFIEGRGEWCISRQRAWGVPIPALYHKETDEAVLSPESIDHIIQVIKERGIDRWWSDAPDDPAWLMPGLPVDEYIRGKDTMDVWFDSGSSWSLMPGEVPKVADVYLEGSDQHRGWFQSSILTAVAYQKALSATSMALAPFKQLITHGFTLDGEGKKMSKSIGNVVSPEQIINGLKPTAAKPSAKGRIIHPLGPDALRLWAASADWTSDVIISDEVVSTIHKTLDKYRVTMKVLLGMLADFDPQRIVEFDKGGSHLERPPINQNPRQHDPWVHRIALLSLHTVVTNVRRHMQNFEFHKALATINEWVAKDISASYLESIKDSIYCDSVDSQERRMAQTVLYHIFTHFQAMIAPVLPLLVEEVYEYTPDAIRTYAGHPSKRVWEPLPDAWADEILASALPKIKAINTAVKAAQERARAEKCLGQSLACDVDVCFASSVQDLENGEAIARNSDMYKSLLVVSSVTVKSNLDDTTSSDILEQFRSASTEDEKQVIRGAVVQFLNRRREEGDNASKQSPVPPDASHQGRGIPATFVYQVQEVEHPGTDRKGEIMAYVVVREPASGKCSRCWKYNVEAHVPQEVKVDEQQRKEEKIPLCKRCEHAVEDAMATPGVLNELQRETLRQWSR